MAADDDDEQDKLFAEYARERISHSDSATYTHKLCDLLRQQQQHASPPPPDHTRVLLVETLLSSVGDRRTLHKSFSRIRRATPHECLIAAMRWVEQARLEGHRFQIDQSSLFHICQLGCISLTRLLRSSSALSGSCGGEGGGGTGSEADEEEEEEEESISLDSAI